MPCMAQPAARAQSCQGRRDGVSRVPRWGTCEQLTRAALWRQVLVYCLRTLLALAHPLMPFVTERLWGVLPMPRRRPLITAPWPAHTGAIDEAAIAQYEVLWHILRRSGPDQCTWRSL